LILVRTARRSSGTGSAAVMVWETVTRQTFRGKEGSSHHDDTRTGKRS
jgi:hypothetical protein